MQLAPMETGAAPAGFAALYRDRYAAMVRLAYLLVGDEMAAEELVQDAFVRVYRKWASVQDPPAYLRRAVVNACRSHHRRRFVERRHPQQPPEPAGPPQLDETWDLLTGLPPRRRAALVLRFYEGLAFGSTGVQAGGTIWTSEDGGVTWVTAEGVFGPGTMLSAVTRSDAGLVAIGVDETSGIPRGAAWILAPHP